MSDYKAELEALREDFHPTHPAFLVPSERIAALIALAEKLVAHAEAGWDSVRAFLSALDASDLSDVEGWHRAAELVAENESLRRQVINLEHQAQIDATEIQRCHRKIHRLDGSITHERKTATHLKQQIKEIALGRRRAVGLNERLRLTLNEVRVFAKETNATDGALMKIERMCYDALTNGSESNE